MPQMDSTLADGVQDANSDPSSQTVQPNSFDPKKFEEGLLAKFQAMFNDPRTTQSVKDKTIAEIRKDKGFKDFLAEYKNMSAAGMTDREIEMEARLREIESNSAVPTQSPGKGVEPAQTDLGIIAASFGLQNDPEFSSIISGGASHQEKILAMGELYAKRKNTTQPNPALVAQPAGGGVMPPNPAQLEAQYKQEVLANRGNKAAIQNIKIKYASQGLDVGLVSF